LMFHRLARARAAVAAGLSCNATTGRRCALRDRSPVIDGRRSASATIARERRVDAIALRALTDAAGDDGSSRNAGVLAIDHHGTVGDGGALKTGLPVGPDIRAHAALDGHADFNRSAASQRVLAKTEPTTLAAGALA